MTHLITGATGALGQAIVAQVQARNAAEACALGARDPSRLAASGFRTQRVDYDDLASMREAFKGVSTLLLISSNASNEARMRQHAAAIDVAAEVGVERIVYTSFVGADQPDDNPLLEVHHDTERRLRQSGLSWVALRNGLYLDSLLDLLGSFRETRVVAHPAGEAPAAWISRDDIAAFTVDVLLDPEVRDVALEVVLPETHSFRTILRRVEEGTGVEVRYTQPSEDEYPSMLLDVGLDPGTVQVLSEVFGAMRSGALDRSNQEFERRLGRAPESLASYLGRNL
ncbi:MAG: NAD(P)H-binding protein [Myxococcota bacterium]